MKKLLLLLLFSFLFQSCLSYKSVNFDDIKNGKDVKIDVILNKGVEGMRYIKNGELKSVSKEEIRNISVRKFSISKTAEVVIGGYVNSKKN
jgi:uncharacterized GH25 family protein